MRSNVSRRATLLSHVLAALILAGACGRAGNAMGPARSSAGAPVSYDGIEYAGAVSQSGDSIRATLTMTNRSLTDREVRVGSNCTVVLRLYATTPGETPLWDGLERRLCFDQLLVIVLKPGQSRRFVDTISKDQRDGFGREVPSGPLHARAWIRASSEFEIEIGPITVQR